MLLRGRMMVSDYYGVLHLTPAATFDQVHKAYRSLAMEYHPDRNATPDAASMMVAINEAYAVLSEPARRSAYDLQRGRAEPFDVAGPILRAAYETLLKQRWIVARSTDTMLVIAASGVRSWCAAFETKSRSARSRRTRAVTSW